MLRSPWNEIPHTHTSTLTHAQLTCNPRQVCGKWNNLSGHKDQAGHGDGDAVRAKLLGWHRTKLPSNIRETGRDRERKRERERKCGRARGSETHTNTLLIVGTANGSLELALTVKQVDTREEGRRVREVAYYTRFVYIVCIPFQFRFPLLFCLPSSLFNSPFLFALLSSCLCCCKFAWLQFSFWFFLRLLWRRARHSKLCSFNLLTPCRVVCMGCIRRRLSEFFCELSSGS